VTVCLMERVAWLINSAHVRVHIPIGRRKSGPWWSRFAPVQSDDDSLKLNFADRTKSLLASADRDELGPRLRRFSGRFLANKGQRNTSICQTLKPIHTRARFTMTKTVERQCCLTTGPHPFLM